MKTKKDLAQRQLPKPLLVAFAVLAAALFTFCVYRLAGIFIEYKKGQDAYATIKSAIVTEAPVETGESDENIQLIDFSSLYAINGDCVGWIQIPGGAINYPMVQGHDNDYYLRRTFEGESYVGGVIFLDYRSSEDFTDRNTIIYGHHMNDGTMFAQLADYLRESFAEKHPQIYIYTPSSLLIYDVFAACRTDILNACYTFSFASDDDFVSWGIRMRAQSAWESAIPISAADNVITLSTCTNVVKSERYIVQAVLVERRALPKP